MENFRNNHTALGIQDVNQMTELRSFPGIEFAVPRFNKPYILVEKDPDSAVRDFTKAYVADCTKDSLSNADFSDYLDDTMELYMQSAANGCIVSLR